MSPMSRMPRARCFSTSTPANGTTELLAALDVPRSLLPEVVSCSEVAAETADGAFMAGVPIAGIAGDQQAALFGQTCFQPGMAKNTYGTGCFMLMTTGSGRAGIQKQAAHHRGVAAGRRHGVCAGGERVHRRGGGAMAAGRARDHPAFVRGRGAGRERAGQWRGVSCPGVFRAGRAALGPLRARDAGRADTRHHRGAHRARRPGGNRLPKPRRAESDGTSTPASRSKELRVDGGASLNNLLMQFQADLLQVPVVRPKITETTALGAAYLAGLAVGYWKDRAEIAEHWSIDRRFHPGRKPREMAALRGDWERAVERSKNWEHTK